MDFICNIENVRRLSWVTVQYQDEVYYRKHTEVEKRWMPRSHTLQLRTAICAVHMNSGKLTAKTSVNRISESA